MDIYHNAKAALNDFLAQAVEAGVPQEEIVYYTAKAADDLVTLKRHVLLHKQDEPFDE